MSKHETKAAVAVSSGIVEDPHEKAGHRGFQSKEAMKQATVSRVAPNEEDQETILGEVADFSATVKKPIDSAAVEDDTKLVKVRSREYIAPFSYGPKQYVLPAGKDVLIPKAVKRHLEEKGKL